MWFFLFLLLSVFDIQNWFNESYLYYIPGKYKNRGKQILFLVFIWIFLLDISCILYISSEKGGFFSFLGNVDLNINIICADVNRIINFSSPFFLTGNYFYMWCLYFQCIWKKTKRENLFSYIYVEKTCMELNKITSNICMFFSVKKTRHT